MSKTHLPNSSMILISDIRSLPPNLRPHPYLWWNMRRLARSWPGLVQATVLETGVRWITRPHLFFIEVTWLIVQWLPKVLPTYLTKIWCCHCFLIIKTHQATTALLGSWTLSHSHPTQRKKKSRHTDQETNLWIPSDQSGQFGNERPSPARFEGSHC